MPENKINLHRQTDNNNKGIYPYIQYSTASEINHIWDIAIFFRGFFNNQDAVDFNSTILISEYDVSDIKTLRWDLNWVHFLNVMHVIHLNIDFEMIQITIKLSVG